MDKARVLEEMWNRLAKSDVLAMASAMMAGWGWSRLSQDERDTFVRAFDEAYDNIHGED